MEDVECPYCGEWQEICHDEGQGYAEDEIHEQQCGDCDKYFAFTTTVICHYDATKAPCMNGGAHDWKASSTHPVEYTKMVCSYCGHKRAPTDDEWPAIMAKNTPPTT